MTTAASIILALAMLVAPDMMAQTRSSSSGSTRSTTSRSSTSTRSGSSSSSTVRSGSTSSQSGTRSSGTVRSGSTSSQSTRSSGTVRSGSTSSQSTRSSGSSTSGTVRSGSTSSQSTRSSGTVRSGSTSSQSTRSSGSSTSGAVRSSGSSNTVRSSGSSSSGTVRSGNAASGTVRSSGSSAGTSVRSSGSSSSVRSSSTAATGGTVRSCNVSRNGLSGGSDNANAVAVQETYKDNGGNYRYNDVIQVDANHNVMRMAPRMREPMPWDRPGYFWGDHPHYYGYRIHSLPPSWRRISHWGIDYYYYNGIYYRSYGASYVVCRPPFGTPLERAIDRAILNVIRFAYYCDTYRTYSRTFDYYNVIARQNLIIAQQNARLAAANASYAINANRALTAYELAEKLGLVQSYAYANSNYYYQDGVFYTISASGVYTTIVPPAGALVSSLPDDYEIIVMNGVEYYMVDNTVYRTTLFEGMPYLEVLGQMYGSLYSQYNVYR